MSHFPPSSSKELYICHLYSQSLATCNRWGHGYLAILSLWRHVSTVDDGCVCDIKMEWHDLPGIGLPLRLYALVTKWLTFQDCVWYCMTIRLTTEKRRLPSVKWVYSISIIFIFILKLFYKSCIIYMWRTYHLHAIYIYIYISGYYLAFNKKIISPYIFQYIYVMHTKTTILVSF